MKVIHKVISFFLIIINYLHQNHVMEFSIILLICLIDEILDFLLVEFMNLGHFYIILKLFMIYEVIPIDINFFSLMLSISI